MPTGTLGVDGAPRIDKAVLSQGIIAAQRDNDTKIFATDGRLVAQGSVVDQNSSIGILGFSPEGDRLFYSSGGGCGGLLTYLAFTADGSRIFFDTCLPEAITHQALPEAIRSKSPEVKRGDQVLYMDPDGRQVGTLSLGLPGFACASPAPSPTENVVAVDCWGYPEGTGHNVYMVRLDGGMTTAVERVTDLKPGERMMPFLWSADGRYLVGWDGEQRSSVIYVLDVRTRELKRVRPVEGRAFLPVEWQWDHGPGYRLYTLMLPSHEETVLQPGHLVRVDLLSGEIEQVLPDELHNAWVRLTSPNRRIR